MTTRRNFLKAAATVVGASVPHVLQPGTKHAIGGVGVLRFPTSREYVDHGGHRISASQIAVDVAEHIRQGTVLALPSDRDEHGAYCWDFRIEGGDPGQVRVERQE